MHGRTIPAKAGGSATATHATLDGERGIALTVVDERGERKAALVHLTLDEAGEFMSVLDEVGRYLMRGDATPQEPPAPAETLPTDDGKPESVQKVELTNGDTLTTGDTEPPPKADGSEGERVTREG
jgi:hypothetical protein